MNRFLEMWLRGMASKDATPVESDLVNGSFDPATGVFTDAKGKQITPADKDYDRIYKGIQADGSYRSPELYKPVTSWLAQTMQPEMVSAIDKANTDWRLSPTLENDKDAIASGILKKHFDQGYGDFQRGILSPDNFGKTGTFGQGLEDIAYNNKGGFQQNAQTKFQQQLRDDAQARNATAKALDAELKGLPFTENQTAELDNQAQQTINRSTIHRTPISDQLFDADMANKMFSAETQSQLNPLERRAAIANANLGASVNDWKVNNLPRTLDTMDKEAQMNNITAGILGGANGLREGVATVLRDGSLVKEPNTLANPYERLMAQKMEEAVGEKPGVATLPNGNIIKGLPAPPPQFSSFGASRPPTATIPQGEPNAKPASGESA